MTPEFSFTPAQMGRAGEDVALQIEAAILDGTFLPGERLPSERELQSQFHTGRGVVREALGALKQKGLSGPVIAAMIAAADAAAAPAMSLDAADPMIPHPAGVYVLSTDGPQKMVAMQPTASTQAKTGGLLGYAFTGGIASLSIKASIAGDKALVTTSPTPTFYFFFDDSNVGTVNQSST